MSIITWWLFSLSSGVVCYTPEIENWNKVQDLTSHSWKVLCKHLPDHGTPKNVTDEEGWGIFMGFHFSDTQLAMSVCVVSSIQCSSMPMEDQGNWDVCRLFRDIPQEALHSLKQDYEYVSMSFSLKWDTLLILFIDVGLKRTYSTDQ